MPQFCKSVLLEPSLDGSYPCGKSALKTHTGAKQNTKSYAWTPQLVVDESPGSPKLCESCAPKDTKYADIERLKVPTCADIERKGLYLCGKKFLKDPLVRKKYRRAALCSSFGPAMSYTRR